MLTQALVLLCNPIFYLTCLACLSLPFVTQPVLVLGTVFVFTCLFPVAAAVLLKEAAYPGYGGNDSRLLMLSGCSYVIAGFILYRYAMHPGLHRWDAYNENHIHFIIGAIAYAVIAMGIKICVRRIVALCLYGISAGLLMSVSVFTLFSSHDRATLFFGMYVILFGGAFGFFILRQRILALVHTPAQMLISVLLGVVLGISAYFVHL